MRRLSKRMRILEVKSVNADNFLLLCKKQTNKEVVEIC
jgi:hypothetical protein